MSAPQIGDVISTAEELDALPSGIVVWSAGGTLAGRYDGGRGVVLGDDRSFPWKILALPVTVIFVGADHPPRPERVVKAEVLRQAADAWQTGGWSDDLPPNGDRPALILGMAQRATNYLRTRADSIERGEP